MEPFVRPAGPVDAEEIARVQNTTWRATYAQMLSAETLARVETAWSAAYWRHTLERTDDRTVTLVLDGKETGVFGFGVAGARRGGGGNPVLQPYAGEIFLLYLLPAFQGRGHGVRLMAAMARVLKARGMDSALVWALADNRSAIGFYERLSGTVLMQCRKPFFSQSLEEIALGWPDIGVLANLPSNLR